MKPTKELMDFILNNEEIQREFKYTSKGKSFFENFTEETYSDLRYIIDNEKAISESEWQTYFEKYKKDVSSPVLQALMESDYISDDLRNDMVNYLIKGDYRDRLLFNEQRDHTLMRALLKPNITHQNVLAITEYMSKRQSDMSLFIYNFAKDIKEEYLKIIADRYLQIKSEARKTNCNEILKYCLLNISDEKFIRKILERYPLEKYRNILVSNNKLSDKFRKEIYDTGVDIKKINFKELSKDVFDDAYACVCDAFFELEVNAKNFEKEKKMGLSNKESIKAFSDAKNILWYVIPNLTSAQEYDLFLRLKNLNLTKENETMRKILLETSNEQILKEATTLKSVVHREQAYLNKHTPKDLINQRIKDISEKAVGAYRKNGSIKISNRDVKLLLDLMEIKGFEISEEMLLILAKASNEWDKRALASKRDVPDSVLDEILNYTKMTPMTFVKDANLEIITKLNKNVDKAYQHKSFNKFFKELSYIAGGYGYDGFVCDVVRMYEDNLDTKPFVENIIKELDVLISEYNCTTRSRYLKSQCKEMKKLLNQVMNEINIIESGKHKVSKQSLLYELNSELQPFLSHKYFALDFYMEIEKKTENIVKILSSIDDVKREEIMMEKSQSR